MKKVITLVTALVFVLGTFALALDITMDAERDDFYNTLTGPVDGYIYLDKDAEGIAQGGVEDDIDLSAHVWFAWDTTFFYCYAEVTDDIILVNNATQYENDAIELKLDPDPLAIDETVTGVAAYRMSAWGEDDAEVPEGVHNVNSGEAGTWPWDVVEGEDYARQEIVSDTRYGYNVEFRIPFETVYTGDRFVDNSIGGIMGMAVNVMDNDATGREHVLRWASNMDDLVWNEPTRHGMVTFLEGNKISMSTENAITGVDTNTVDYTPPATGVATDVETPTEFNLAQNYPNPFNPSTNIEFALPTATNVTLDVFNLLGVKVASLVSNQVMQAGVHRVTFDASEMNSGVYIYQLQAGADVMTKKMMFIK